MSCWYWYCTNISGAQARTCGSTGPSKIQLLRAGMFPAFENHCNLGKSGSTSKPIRSEFATRLTRAKTEKGCPENVEHDAALGPLGLMHRCPLEPNNARRGHQYPGRCSNSRADARTYRPMKGIGPEGQPESRV